MTSAKALAIRGFGQVSDPAERPFVPPEDVGGSGGYQHLLTVIADLTHEEYPHLSEWVSRPVDPTEFDLALVNAHLQGVR